MKKKKIIICGAGGIAQAAGLMLAEWSEQAVKIYIANRTLEKAEKVAGWIKKGCSKEAEVLAMPLPSESMDKTVQKILKEAGVLLDCLPGSLAPKMAGFAKAYKLNYANLTEYVAETNEIIELAGDAETGFVLQTGLAPGYIDVLAHKLYLDFCKENRVELADKLELRVGALTDHAIAPHFYGFTWSPIGVATEYLKDCVVIRNYKKTQLPALSGRAGLIIDGIAYEEDLTSGGAADLPDALAGMVKDLDYKTLRHPGHYDWVEEQLSKMPDGENPVMSLQAAMLRQIPLIEDDQVIIYAAVQGKDSTGNLRRREASYKIKPLQVGKHTLRAIQTTTAAPLLQAMQYLLDQKPKGLVLQSQIDPDEFLNGFYIRKVYS